MIKLKKIKCKNCNKIIYKSLGRINENFKLGNNFYCSRKCESQYKNKKKILTCENCGKQFKRRPSEISKHNYCSRSCAATTNNAKLPKRKAAFKICLQCQKKYKKENLKYCSLSCRRRAEGKTKEELLELIKKSAEKLRRTPAKRELKSISNLCCKNFGTWNNAILEANLTPNRSHDDRMYKRIKTKALDGHLCDSVSELIIDNWLTENKIYHQKNISYPETQHKADWGINLKGKTIFVEYFGLAKDSPRYDLSILKKKALCQKHKIKLISVYPRDLYPKINLRNKLKIFLN